MDTPDMSSELVRLEGWCMACPILTANSFRALASGALRCGAGRSTIGNPRLGRRGVAEHVYIRLDPALDSDILTALYCPRLIPPPCLRWFPPRSFPCGKVAPVSVHPANSQLCRSSRPNRVPSCGRTAELSPFVFAVGAISGYSCRPRRVVYAQDRPSQGRAIAPTRSTITGHAFI